MKYINLSRGYRAIVDDIDFERINKWKWYVMPTKSTPYAIRFSGSSTKRKAILMHREILGISDSKVKIDHKNHNGLDNQKSNLRPASNSQNRANSKIKIHSSQYKGVHWSQNRWYASISENGRCKYLGSFISEIEAATIYDKEALRIFGEFANVNFPNKRY